MAKNKKKEAKEDSNPEVNDELDIDKIPNLSKEAKEKLGNIKKNVEKFKKEVLAKFDKYIMGISLLPPQKNPSIPNMPPGISPGIMNKLGPQIAETKPKENEISILILINDFDSKKMSKYELKIKLTQIIEKIAKDIDPGISPETLILSEVWQNCYDAKYDLLGRIASGAIVYDTGMLAAIKISEIHKQMVLKKFEKYIVTYVLAGSLVQGKSKPDSDIDVFVVIDDTDVKKMTRLELKDKLRAIIIGMGLEAGELTKIKNKLNIQVYILTDFWDNIKEANPIIFTFLRDGIPFYDRGIFMPWKQLLQMGKVKPSPEAIDLFMSSGEQMVARVKYKLNSIGMEDIFYALLTPSQAALMLYGIPPPTPKETPDLMREVFVKKEKLLEEEYVKILENNIKIRKDLEHQSKKELTGKEVDQLLGDADKYLKRIKKLFKQIEKVKEEEDLVNTYELTITIMRDIMKLEGIERVKEEHVTKTFEQEIIDSGKIPHKYLRMIKEVVKAKEDYDSGKLTKTDISGVKKISKELHKTLTEYILRKRGKEIERATIRVKHGKLFGEILLLGKVAYITHDLDSDEKKVSKAEIADDGSLQNLKESSIAELEKVLAEESIPKKVFIKQPIFENLKDIFGKDVEVMIHH
ncbi:MAG: nucleotidyltransferase domain-containing protein [Nanoarchaeota archaeon]